MADAKMDITGLDNLINTLKGNTRAMAAGMHDIGVVYMSFTRRRYIKFSRGGGDWKALKPATVKRRKKGKGKKAKGASAKILVDTGILLNALSPGAPGYMNKMIGKKKVRVGFGKTQHKSKKGEKKKPMTYQRLADIHQRGLGNSPAREIFVKPDRPALRRMRKVLKVTIEKGVKTG